MPLKVTTLLAPTVLLFLASSSVQAGPITVAPGTPHQSVLIDTTQDMLNANPGTLLASLTDALTIGSNHIVGTVTSAVYRNSSGFLDFYYQVVNTTPPGGTNTSISGLSGYNFGGATTAVGYYSNASAFGGVFSAPVYFFGSWNEGRPRSADRSADGNVVTLWFGPPWGSTRIDAGESSSIVMIQTNATSFSAGWATLQNGGPASTGTVRSFQVPEPTSGAVAFLGFALVAAARRRRKHLSHLHRSQRPR